MSRNEFLSPDPNYNPNPSIGSFGPVYLNQAPQSQPQPQQQPRLAAQPASAYAYATPVVYPQQNSGTPDAMVVSTSVPAVVLLGLVGAVVYVSLGRGDLVTVADTQPAVTMQVAADTQGRPAPAVTQTEIVVALNSGSSSGFSGSPRSSGLTGDNLSSARKGTPSTSDSFVRNVYSAYARYRNSTGRESGTVTAYSPTTGLTYDM